MKIRDTIPMYVILDSGQPAEVRAMPIVIPSHPELALVQHGVPPNETDTKRLKPRRITEYWTGACVGSGHTYALALNEATEKLRAHSSEIIYGVILKQASLAWERFMAYHAEILK